MAKIDKLIEKFLSDPKDFTWEELVKVLGYYGYNERKAGKTGGSRRKFIDDAMNIISLHKPHPSSILKSYIINQIIASLTEKGKIKRDE